MLSGTMPTGMAGSAAVDSLRHPDDASMAWLRSKSRHYFIISNGGRPIYTRHGQPNDAAAISALLFGLASLSHDALGANAPQSTFRHQYVLSPVCDGVIAAWRRVVRAFVQNNTKL